MARSRTSWWLPVWLIAVSAWAAPELTVNGVNANYTTTKFFLNEIARETNYVHVIFKPNAANLEAVEIFTNLDRRDQVTNTYVHATLGTIEEGICPPDGNTISTNDATRYYRAYVMVDLGGSVFSNRLPVTKCGAYRLTARYKVAGNPNWIWYNDFGNRDHAIVVSPKKALDMTLYELNTLTVEATDNTEAGRSTFIDLLGAADGDTDGFDPFNLDYLNTIQANCLWFQPIHPVGVERGEGYTPGSPYATRDYFAVASAMGAGNTEASAMTEFTNFVAQCDAYTNSVGPIHIMLDGVFNHTSWDARMGQGGVDLGFTTNANDRIAAVRPGWYARLYDYCQPATYYNSAFDNDISVAPDRGDFGKWNDVAELYFGRYAALVCLNPQDNGNYLNEGDWYDYSSMTPDVRDLWRYFGYYAEYWLQKTGHPGTNSWNLALDDKGIDGLRCDFGQGLPPQLWEYIINRTRTKKWNFVFMAETLDGGIPGYRSNRHFDILNENMVFQFTQSHVNNSWEIRNALEARRTAYSSGAILLNLTSHDEVLPDNDAWVTATRYGAVSMIEGLPMIFYGQEQGIQNYDPANAVPCCWYYDGFKTDHELNFGKYVPHFKQWNKLTVWENPPPNNTGMAQWYGRVNWARLNSPALRSPNRYFLSRRAGGDNPRILAAAKYETPFGNPASNDVVLAFALLLPHGSPHVGAADVYDLRPVFSLLGLSFTRQYNVRNLASSDASALLWATPKTGQELWNDGLYVSLKADTYGSITDDGSLVQYLKIVDAGPVPTGNWNFLGIPGDWSGWTDSVAPWRLTKVPPPGTPAARDWYTNTIYCASSGGDITPGTYQFKLRANGTWTPDNSWGGGATVAIDAITSLGWQGANASITLAAGNYYSFRLLDPTAGAAAPIAVLKTSARPVGLSHAGATPAAPLTNEPVTVSINLTAPKSSEERIFVRWTTNDWAGSELVLASGSGTSYSATIPAMPNGRVVRYYLLSSTVTPTHSTADALTLNLDTNGGLNYAYTVHALPWPGGAYAAGYPHDPPDRIRHDREEAVIGNGFLTAMLDRNGSLYDIYFPSVGVRSGSGTANESYRGPQSWPQDEACRFLTLQANGQMNVIAGCGGLGIAGNIYWLNNVTSNYTDVGQTWASPDALIVYTSNRLNVVSQSIKVEQYDFVPAETVLPVITDGTRTNRGAYIKRFLLTNQEASDRTVDFYWDVNFNVKGDNAHDEWFWDTTGGRNQMIVRDIVGRVATGTWCGPDGYGTTPATQYDPTGGAGWSKSNSVYFATVMKVVTNTLTGHGLPAAASWRNHTATDQHEGWIGRRVTLPAGQTIEINVLIVGSWDDAPGMTGTHDFWGVPIVDWFYTNNMANAQAATAGYWSNWLASAVSVDLPGTQYDELFRRSLLITALHCDRAGGGIIAGMHNGAYPFVWPRDGVYTAITLARAGLTNEAKAFFRWLENAQRPHDTGIGDKGFFFQKYSTDGKPVWTSPQVDETAAVPWGLYYYWLVTGDTPFLHQHWNLAYTAARASSEDSAVDTRLFFNDTTRRMSSNNIWEDQWGEFLYSNASVVRGLRDAAAIASLVGSSSWATVFNDRANDIHTNGILARLDARTETSDISHLGLSVPFEILPANDPRMTNVVEWLHGRQTAGGYTGAAGNLVETGGDIAGLVRRYNRKTHDSYGDLDNYWNGGPWFMASSWYGMHYTRWQDHVAGQQLVSTNLTILDKLIAKLGPLGLGAEQIAAETAEQKYPGFWLQTAWPNTWESHSTLLDQMMMFLDYRPLSNDVVALAPKLPAAWSTMGFSNLLYRGQRFDVGVSLSATESRVDIRKRTAGSLGADVWLRLPATETPGVVFVNGTPTGSYTYDAVARRVRVEAALSDGDNSLVVTFGAADQDGDGVPDSVETALGSNPFSADSDGDGMPDGFEYLHGFNLTDAADAGLDADGDGQTNLAEYLTGTHPLQAGSVLRIVSIQRLVSGEIVLTWDSVAGKQYVVQGADVLPGPFTDLSGTNTATGATSVYTNSAAGTQRFYRVRWVP